MVEYKKATRTMGKELYLGMLLGIVFAAIAQHYYGVSLHELIHIKHVLQSIGLGVLLVLLIYAKLLVGRRLFGRQIKLPENTNSTRFKIFFDGSIGVFLGYGLGYTALYLYFG